MPLVSSCPQCRKALAIADSLAGQKVRCPHCQTVYQAPSAGGAPAAPPPPPAPPPLPPPAPVAQELSAPFESAPMATFPEPAPPGGHAWDRLAQPGGPAGYPSPYGGRDSMSAGDFGEREPLEEGWDAFRLGIQLTSIGLIVLISLEVVNILLGVFARAIVRDMDGLKMFQMMVICLLVFMALAALLYLGGVWTCLMMPAQTRGKGLVVAGDCCISAGGLFFVMGVVSATMARAFDDRTLSVVIAMIGFVIFLVGKTLFLVGLRYAAQFLGDRPMAQHILYYILFGIGLPVGLVLFLILVIAGTSGGRASGDMEQLVGLLVIVMAIASGIWQFFVLQQLRTSVSRAIRRAPGNF